MVVLSPSRIESQSPTPAPLATVDEAIVPTNEKSMNWSSAAVLSNCRPDRTDERLGSAVRSAALNASVHAGASVPACHLVVAVMALSLHLLTALRSPSPLSMASRSPGQRSRPRCFRGLGGWPNCFL